MRNLIIFALLGFLLAATTSAGAGSSICVGVDTLKLIHSKAQHRRSVENPAATVQILRQLEREISRSPGFLSTSELVSAVRNLSALNAKLSLSVDDQPESLARVRGPMVFWHLSAIMGDLTVVRDIFGCTVTPKPDTLAKSPSPGQPSAAHGEGVSYAFSILAPYLVYAWILVPIVLWAFDLVKPKRRNDRKICNIFLHVVYGEKCTVTKIVDISRSGMKIEAAAQEVDKKWIDFHFSGRKVEGRIAWRTMLYAGVKFRKNLSEDALTEIMATSNKPMSESGIEKTSTACFHEGCHLACPHHLPTVLSLRAQGH